MSTRSRIALKNDDGTIRSVYCHFDGYPEGGVGEKLKKYYTTKEKINKLLDLGDLSTLGKKYDEEKAKLYWKAMDSKIPSEWGNIPEVIRGYTIPYKDRSGEKETEARIDENEKDFIEKVGECWEDWTYLFDDGKWIIMEEGKEL